MLNSDELKVGDRVYSGTYYPEHGRVGRTVITEHLVEHAGKTFRFRPIYAYEKVMRPDQVSLVFSRTPEEAQRQLLLRHTEEVERVHRRFSQAEIELQCLKDAPVEHLTLERQEQQQREYQQKLEVLRQGKDMV